MTRRRERVRNVCHRNSAPSPRSRTGHSGWTSGGTPHRVVRAREGPAGTTAGSGIRPPLARGLPDGRMLVVSMQEKRATVPSPSTGDPSDARGCYRGRRKRRRRRPFDGRRSVRDGGGPNGVPDTARLSASRIASNRSTSRRGSWDATWRRYPRHQRIAQGHPQDGRSPRNGAMPCDAEYGRLGDGTDHGDVIPMVTRGACSGASPIP